MKKYFPLSSWILLLEKLGKEKQKILSPQTLQQASGLSWEAALKAIQRLSRSNYLIKLYKKTYANKFSLPSLEEVAMFYGKPCYISFESVLSDHGILSQSPLVLTCATTQKLKNLKTPLGEIVFHHLHPRLFSGFENNKGVLRATAEKALLDYLYINLKNKGAVPSMDEFDLEQLNHKKIRKIAKDFPRSVQEHLKTIFWAFSTKAKEA
jgi:predicted transcriptional regulator of viral defense system